MKRFTETEKWRDPWFRRLKPEHKLAWEYICDTCDNSGVLVVDWDLFSYLSGVTIDEAEVLAAFSDRIEDIGRGRWWVKKFIHFQFGEINPESESRVHQSVLGLLHQHGIYTHWIGYQKAIYSTKDKDKDKDRKGGQGENQINGQEQAERVYQAFPLKVGKPEALKAIRRALTKEPFEALLAKTEAFAAARSGALEFCPHPSTWFNQERYNDDPATWCPKRKEGGSGPPSTTLTLEQKLAKEALADAQRRFGRKEDKA